jgi:hypothetical protein
MLISMGLVSRVVSASWTGVSGIIVSTHRTWGASFRGNQLKILAAFSSVNCGQKYKKLDMLKIDKERTFILQLITRKTDKAIHFLLLFACLFLQLD